MLHSQCMRPGAQVHSAVRDGAQVRAAAPAVPQLPLVPRLTPLPLRCPRPQLRAESWHLDSSPLHTSSGRAAVCSSGWWPPARAAARAPKALRSKVPALAALDCSCASCLLTRSFSRAALCHTAPQSAPRALSSAALGVDACMPRAAGGSGLPWATASGAAPLSASPARCWSACRPPWPRQARPPAARAAPARPVRSFPALLLPAGQGGALPAGRSARQAVRQSSRRMRAAHRSIVLGLSTACFDVRLGESAAHPWRGRGL